MIEDSVMDLIDKRIKRKSKEITINLNTLDELEIITPTNRYVLGIDGKGELVIGETKWSPQLLKVVSIKNHPSHYGFTVQIPEEIQRQLNIGAGTKYTRIKIFKISRDILLRPFRIEKEYDDEHCEHCGVSIFDVPSNRKPCRLSIDNKMLYFCCKRHRRFYKRAKIGVTGKNINLI